MQTFTQAIHTCNYIHGRNDFVEISKNLDMDLKIILYHQNNYVESSNIISKVVNNFDVLATSLN